MISDASGGSRIVGVTDQGSDPIDEAWDRVLTHWDDDEAHRKFIALCATLGRLDFAGTRYRKIRDTEPERAEQASSQIDRLLSHAMKNLEPLRTQAPRRAKGVVLLVAFVITAALLGLTVWATLRTVP